MVKDGIERLGPLDAYASGAYARFCSIKLLGLILQSPYCLEC